MKTSRESRSSLHVAAQSAYLEFANLTPFLCSLALKKSGALHVLADKYDEDSHGHFERMVELGEPAKDCKVTAVFNGDIVEVHVRKLPKEEIVSTTSISNWSYPSSASSTSSSLYKSIGSYSPSMYHGGTDPVAFYSSSPLLAGASYMAK